MKKLELDQMVSRWLLWKNLESPSSAESYDFELDMALSDSDADKLLEFLDNLAEQPLSEAGKINLGAGLLEDFFCHFPGREDELKSLFIKHTALAEAAAYIWPDEEHMSDDALAIVSEYSDDD